jgi:trans-aconitate methyltransferase
MDCQTVSVDPTEALLADQVRYYRARAAEFDQSVYRTDSDGAELPKSPADDERLVRSLGLSGDVLELACGTGSWTQHIARVADTVLAVDVAAEMLEFARPKIRSSNVTFLQADALTWSPDRHFDAVFFAFWLSHVPPRLFDRFWERLAAMLRDGGRVVAIDELPDRRDLETHLTMEDGLPVARRQLRDGSRHRLVKVFYAADELCTALNDLGWTADVRALPRGLFLLEAQRQR